ncbi:uncharacterized protein F5Z01DRAFT_656770 [Emericellopsis atlantica]|uniref:Stress response RCI peptide n=1 Tax=Emericellopsis atlantica TaxID=2614577 RepID=A0A9P7ZKV9_9HYPO|nr:uncharacterized protein F5Z01DRAFT_656770 [Emericellopsis atlantica]KAG9253811.1 hypothetical protein F5Z01DRAFT_656770 [Emericellopsis atlantica]
MCSTDIFLGVLAVLFPPLPVWVKRGICSADSVINVLLSILGYLPGLIHAIYIIAKYPDEDMADYDYESLPQRGRGGQRHIIYVVDGSQRPQQSGYGTQGPPKAQPQPQHQGVEAGGSSSQGDHGVPPSYADVVAGDNKVQTHD